VRKAAFDAARPAGWLYSNRGVPTPTGKTWKRPGNPPCERAACGLRVQPVLHRRNPPSNPLAPRQTQSASSDTRPLSLRQKGWWRALDRGRRRTQPPIIRTSGQRKVRGARCEAGKKFGKKNGYRSNSRSSAVKRSRAAGPEVFLGGYQSNLTLRDRKFSSVGTSRN